MLKILIPFILVAILSQFSFAGSKPIDTLLYSRAAEEYVVNFRALVQSDFKSLEQVRQFSGSQKQSFEEYVLKPTTKFLFGPMTNRSLGGEQKDFGLEILWQEAYLEGGLVIIPYEYSGLWLINKKIRPGRLFELPLPLNTRVVKTPLWKNCTDPLPDHQDFGSFWYYWDPARTGCDHQLGKHFQIIKPQLKKKTAQTTVSYPEYDKMIRNKKVTLTFGFGYVEDPAEPMPFSDADYGMAEFRSFLSMIRNDLRIYNFKETEILEKEYLGGRRPDRRIGSRFEFEKQGLNLEVKVVASGSVDQMELFAKSFSHDHDAFFGWFGHSRVGNGFDALQFSRILKLNPSYYNLTPDYQMIYWAGCNSYSYYTKPFFDFKANLIPQDVNGTKGLDIISNALQSYFSLNADNAAVLLNSIVNLEQRTSYQTIVNQIERQSNASGIEVLVNVLGDEDNP